MWYIPDFVSLVFINDKNKLMMFETDNILQDKPQSSKLCFYFVIDAERLKKKIARRIYRADGTSGSWSSRVKRVNSLLHTRSRVRKKNAAVRGGGAARRTAGRPRHRSCNKSIFTACKNRRHAVPGNELILRASPWTWRRPAGRPAEGGKKDERRRTFAAA